LYLFCGHHLEDWYLSEFEVHRHFNKAWGCKFLSDNLGSSFMFSRLRAWQRVKGGLPEVSDYSQGSMANIEAPLLSQDDDIPGLVKGQYALGMLM